MDFCPRCGGSLVVEVASTEGAGYLTVCTKCGRSVRLDDTLSEVLETSGRE